MTTNLQSIKPDRPNIITSEINGIKFYRKMDTESVVNQMIAGKSVIVEEYYSNGLQVLAELKKNLSLRYSDKSFQGQRAYRAAFREASHRLFIKVIDNKRPSKPVFTSTQYCTNPIGTSADLIFDLKVPAGNYDVEVSALGVKTTNLKLMVHI